METKTISVYAIPGVKERRFETLTLDNFNLAVSLLEERYELEKDSLLAKNRAAPLPYIRFLLTYYIRRRYSMNTVVNIASMMGSRDHTTIISSTQAFQNKLDTNELLGLKVKSDYATVREDYLHTSKYLNTCL